MSAFTVIGEFAVVLCGILAFIGVIWLMSDYQDQRQQIVHLRERINAVEKEGMSRVSALSTHFWKREEIIRKAEKANTAEPT